MDSELKPRTTRSGYTLIEVLVAAVILMIALPGVVVMLTGARKTQVASTRMEQAMSYGQLVLDSLSLIPDNIRTAAVDSSKYRIGSTVYTSTWTMPAVSGGARSVVVVVRWTQGSTIHSVNVGGVLR
jgi:prepilin-type N-terminal cleavage/methylation domain-containing protein